MNVLLIKKVYRAKNGKIRAKGGHSDAPQSSVNIDKITNICIDITHPQQVKFSNAVKSIENGKNEIFI